MKNQVIGIDFVVKGWGWEEILTNQPLYCGKNLVIHKDKKLSVHYHKLKDETFFCLEGPVVITYYFDDKIDSFLNTWDDVEDCVNSKTIEREVLLPGDAFHIPVGLRHTVKALKDAKILEVSTQHFDSDSYRVLKGD